MQTLRSTKGSPSSHEAAPRLPGWVELHESGVLGKAVFRAGEAIDIYMLIYVIFIFVSVFIFIFMGKVGTREDASLLVATCLKALKEDKLGPHSPDAAARWPRILLSFKVQAHAWNSI